ncbi:hypothetical protein BC937DRAFT_87754 [Endogone sp. FLAS-F59071]|nr:hypothetical protein BC937DRAFT_87754 [Endogone sp. FLAS-F59071]|eukprot:RUS19264.1 hypothetical protein BC937DRAFT_87754 [Endogone sp. FLAS-F59071]
MFKLASLLFSRQSEEILPRSLIIPNDSDAIVSMLTDLNLMNHIGIRMALRSKTANRSIQNPVIILFGITGAGKSITINKLFGAELCPTGDTKSTTKEVTEYYVEIPSKRSGIENLRLSVIDTPGYGDADEGPAGDAKHAVCLQHFFDTHTSFSKQNLEPVFPSAILIICSLTDTRIKGQASNFAKMLWSIRLTVLDRAIDLYTPNVVFVLTNLGKVNPNKLKQKLTEWEDVITSMAECILGVDNITIVPVENIPEECNYKKSGDFYIQPDKALFPYNLFNALITTTEAARDPVGREAISLYFSNRGSAKVTEVSGIAFKDIENDENKAKVNKLLKELERIASGSQQSEIWKLVDDAAKQLNFNDGDLFKAHCFATLLDIKGFSSKEELPSDLVTFLDGMSINPKLMALMNDLLGNKLQDLTQQLVGNGYNVKEDKKTNMTIFELDNCEHFAFGIRLPNCIEAAKHREITGMAMAFGSQEGYHNQRLVNLGVFNQNRGNVDLMETEARTTVSVKEYRYFTLYIDWNKTLLLSIPFKEALDNLLHEDPTGDKWTQFFDKWGTHVVAQAYGGGAVRTTSKSAAGSTDQDSHPPGSYPLPSSFSPTITVDVFGGDRDYYIDSLAMLDPRSPWRASIPTKPAVLENEMKLIPFYALIGQYSDYTTLTEPMEAAMNIYVGGTVVNPTVQQRAEPSNTIPKTREDATKQTSPESFVTKLGFGSAALGSLPTFLGAILKSPVVRVVPWVATSLAAVPHLPLVCVVVGCVLITGGGIFLAIPKSDLQQKVDRMTQFGEDLNSDA